MADHTLALYAGSCSTYNLDGAIALVDEMPESSFVREQAKAIVATPLAIVAPSRSMSGGSSVKSTARMRIAARLGVKGVKAPPKRAPSTDTTRMKKKARTAEGGPSHQPNASLRTSNVMPKGDVASLSDASNPSSDSVSSHSNTVVGVKKPDGGYAKGLMRKEKPAPKEKEPTKETSQPLRIWRFRKPPVIRNPPGIFESSDEEKTPSRASAKVSISTLVRTMCETVKMLRGELADNDVKIHNLEHELNTLQFGLGHRIAKVARAAGVASVLEDSE